MKYQYTKILEHLCSWQFFAAVAADLLKLNVEEQSEMFVGLASNKTVPTTKFRNHQRNVWYRTNPELLPNMASLVVYTWCTMLFGDYFIQSLNSTITHQIYQQLLFFYQILSGPVTFPSNICLKCLIIFPNFLFCQQQLDDSLAPEDWQKSKTNQEFKLKATKWTALDMQMICY